MTILYTLNLQTFHTMLSLIQIILVAFAVFALARTVVQMRRRHIPFVWGGTLSLVWVATIAVVLLPKTTDLLAARVGIGRGADLVVYVMLVVLLYVVFRLVMRLQSIERDITRLVRHRALEEFEKNDAEKNAS